MKVLPFEKSSPTQQTVKYHQMKNIAMESVTTSVDCSVQVRTGAAHIDISTPYYSHTRYNHKIK
jgi:hypothetical protein